MRKAMLALMLLLSFGSTARAANDVVRVLDDGRVRERARGNANAIGWAHKGEIYAITDRADGWIKVQYGRREGWLDRRVVRQEDGAVQRMLQRVQVQAGPGNRFRNLGLLEVGDRVAVMGKNGEWKRISYRGHIGWINDDDVTTGQVNTNRSRAGFVALPASGPGFYSYSSSSRRWGRPSLIYAIQRTGLRMREKRLPRIGVGDVSLVNGGDISGHASHERGEDVDVRLMAKSGEGAGVSRFSSNYSRSRTQTLVNVFRSEVPVELIFFNDRAVRHTQPWVGHDDHLHIRIR
jgi:uncharacterized protein YgiM (DUF1202 family)